MTKTRVISAMLGLLALAIPLYAREEAPRSHGDEMHGPRGGRLFMVLRIVDALDLGDEKALAVNRILAAADEKREDLGNKFRELEKKIEESLKAAKQDEAALAKLIDQARELHRQKMQVTDDSFAELKKVLTVEEQAKLVLLRSRMRRELGFHGHGAGGHRMGGRWRGGGRGPGPGPGAEPGRGPRPPDADGDE